MTGEPGPLTALVLRYTEVMRDLLPTVTGPEDWAPLTELVAVDDFERVGVFLEVQNWAEYTAMLTQWATATDTFDSTVHRIAELADRVYYEIEERHSHGGGVHVVNSMTVFEFDEDDKIRHLDVYLQQPR